MNLEEEKQEWGPDCTYLFSSGDRDGLDHLGDDRGAGSLPGNGRYTKISRDKV